MLQLSSEVDRLLKQHPKNWVLSLKEHKNLSDHAEKYPEQNSIDWLKVIKNLFM